MEPPPIKSTNWPAPDLWFIDRAARTPDLPKETFGAAADYLAQCEDDGDLVADYVASGLLAMVGAILGKVFFVEVTRSHKEPLAVWCAMIGPPASGKSPSAAPIRNAVFKAQASLQAEYKDWCTAEPDADANERRPNEARRLPRYVAQDVTVEALSQIEQRAPFGLLVERDELSSLTSNRGRYSGGDDQPYYLEAWAPGEYTKDRVTTGSLRIENHLFSLWGGMQPEVFDALADRNQNDDGFLSRFLLFHPELKLPGPICEGIDHSALEAACERMHGFNRGNFGRFKHTELRLTDEAKFYLSDWRANELAKHYHKPGRTGSAVRKLSGIIFRLVGILHVLDWAFGDEDEIELAIDVETARAAVALVERYFIPQIERAYSRSGRSAPAALCASIMRHLQTHNLAEFGKRDAQRSWRIKGAFARGSDAMFDQALSKGKG